MYCNLFDYKRFILVNGSYFFKYFDKCYLLNFKD